MKKLIIVNASSVLQDSAVKATVAPLQTQIDSHFIPAWKDKLTDAGIVVGFAGVNDISALPADCWPIFLNRHSNDEGALGWHDDDPAQNIRTYSRVFVGDCMQFGLSWQTTLSHEALELILDPDIKQVYKMPNGRLASYEACDAVEDDSLGYSIDGFMASDFVLPKYFSTSPTGPYDYRGVLKKPCPALTPGGYMAVTDALGKWTQTTMDRTALLKGKRSAMNGHRRMKRAGIPMDQLRIET